MFVTLVVAFNKSVYHKLRECVFFMLPVLMTIVKCGSNLCFINCKKVPDDTVLIFATASDYDK